MSDPYGPPPPAPARPHYPEPAGPPPPPARPVHYAVLGADRRVQWIGHMHADVFAEVADESHVVIDEDEYHRVHMSAANHRLHEDGTFVELPPPPPPPPTAVQARAQRDELLARSDWMVQPDVPASAELRAKRLAYRQGLRDITSQLGFPTAVEWPAPP